MKQLFLILTALYCVPSLCAQELFIDKMANDTCLFIGNICMDQDIKLKVFENGDIRYKSLTDLMQVDILVGSEFTNELFNSDLCIKLDGYEPFWEGTIFKDTLCLYQPEDDTFLKYKVSLQINDGSLNPNILIMFISDSGSIFGAINYLGMNLDHKCGFCQYIIPEDGESLYEVFISIKGRVYRGCATIEYKADWWFPL